MKRHIIFECETCGKQSENREKIMKCEAAHLGLTISEKQEWESLKERVRYAGAVVSRTKNEETDKTFDEAVEMLIVFEKEHEIKERQVDIMSEKYYGLCHPEKERMMNIMV